MHKIFFSYIILIFFHHTYSQNGQGNSYELISGDPDSTSIPKLPPLDQLIDSAKIHSPLIVSQIDNIMFEEADIYSRKRDILKSLAVYSNYAYGNLGTTTVDPNSNRQVGLSSNSATNFFQVGLQFKLDLYTIFDRKNLIQKEKYEVAFARKQEKEMIQTVKETIIQQYYAIELTKKLLAIYASTKQAAYINLKMAEKQFLDGEIDIADVTRVSNSLAAASVEFEKTKSQYLISYELLELVIGIEFVKP